MRKMREKCDRCSSFLTRSLCRRVRNRQLCVVVRGLCLLILLFVDEWLRSLQRAESPSHTEELRSDDDEIVQPL